MQLKALDIVVSNGTRGSEDIILRALNLEVEAGNIIGIIGKSKTGKSTLAAVLSGHYVPEIGNVLLSSEKVIKRGLLSNKNTRIKKTFFNKLVNDEIDLYKNISKAIKDNPDMLIIDDAEMYPKNDLELLLKIRKEKGVTTILLSSTEELIRKFAQDIYILEHGRLIKSSVKKKESEFIVFKTDELYKKVVKSLNSAGVSESDAESISNVLIDAEIRGHSSHGVGLLPVYLQRVAKGGINLNVKPVWETVFSSVGVINSQGGFGQLAAMEAAKWCAVKAKEFGISAVGIRNNNHIGMLAAYRRPFQDHNVVGLLLNISGPSVSAPGTVKATLGSNTFCLITPETTKHEPFVVDLGTGIVAAGKIRNALASGKEVPEEWVRINMENQVPIL